MWRVCLVFVAACSFTFMPPPTPAMPPTCYDGYEAPVTDTVIAGGAFALAAGTVIHPEGLYPYNHMLYVLVPMALVFTSSAVYGYLTRQHCEHVHADAASRGLATTR